MVSQIAGETQAEARSGATIEVSERELQLIMAMRGNAAGAGGKTSYELTLSHLDALHHIADNIPDEDLQPADIERLHSHMLTDPELYPFNFSRETCATLMRLGLLKLESVYRLTKRGEAELAHWKSAGSPDIWTVETDAMPEPVNADLLTPSAQLRLAMLLEVENHRDPRDRKINGGLLQLAKHLVGQLINTELLEPMAELGIDWWVHEFAWQMLDAFTTNGVDLTALHQFINEQMQS